MPADHEEVAVHGMELAEESGSIGEHAETFFGKEVVEFDPEQGVSEAPAKAYRVATSGYDERLDEWLARFEQLAAQGSALEALVVGCWGGEATADGMGGERVMQTLAAASAQLGNLKALFVGDVAQEESEASWIMTGDFDQVLTAYPRLEHLRINGHPRVGGPIASPSLRSLVLQSATEGEVVRALGAADLPELVHLEIWLGIEDYGGTTTVDDLAPLLAGKSFPKLRYLGLRNGEHQDAVAAAVAAAPILEQLTELDLSLGVLTDEGGAALLASPGIKRLKALDLHYNFFSEPMRTKLEGLGVPELDLDPDDAEEDEYDGEIDRYVSVAE